MDQYLRLRYFLREALYLSLQPIRSHVRTDHFWTLLPCMLFLNVIFWGSKNGPKWDIWPIWDL